MKKIFIILSIMTLSVSAFAQLFSGSLYTGTSNNSVRAVIRPDMAISGLLSNFIITIRLPESVAPTAPAATVITNNLGASFTTAVVTEGGFYYYVFGGTFSSAPNVSYTAGQEVPVIEVQFASLSDVRSTAQFAHIFAGGSSGQQQFYVEVGLADRTNYGTLFYGGPPLTNVAPIAFVGVVTVVPVRLTFFNAVKQDNNALITWSVENQDLDADHFIIERSFNGNTFTAIGRVGTTQGTRVSYSYTDPNLTATRSSGFIYYRLRSVDKDGSFLNSEIKSVKLKDKALTMSLYPNPAKIFTNLTFEMAEAGTVTINISDASGKIVNTVQYNGVKGINQKQIDVVSYPAGMYNFKVQSGSELQTISVMKTN